MSEDSDNIIEQTLGDVNNKKEEKRRKELFKLTSGKPCPECLGLVKHYPSALYCKECKFWIHMGCASSHFVDGKCQQVSGSGAPNSKRFVMPRTNEDLTQLTTSTKRQHIERDLDFTKVYQLPQFQPAPPRPEKPKIEKSGTAEKERKHRSSTRRGRERTPSPGPNKPPLSPLLSSSRSPSPDSSSIKFQQSNKIINKVRGGTPFLFGVSNIACSCFFDVCLICGASGTLYKDLVGCADCGECFHLRCIHYAGSCPPPPGKVWRCSRCSVCYKCGKYTLIGQDGIECSTCSRYYHFACASPSSSLPKKNPQATLFWECDRCKIDRYLESLKKKVEESKHENELKMEEGSKHESELKMEDVTPPPPELEPFEEYSPLHIFPDTRTCLVCGGAESDEMPGNHLLPSGINTWVHTLCAMLTSGTFVMHGRLYELQESARKWAGKPCGVCGKCDNGATVACAHSGCARVFHPLCAAKLKGGKLYTNKDPRVYRKEVYLFYCDEHGCAHPPGSPTCKPPRAKVPRLGEYTDIDAYREITFESVLEGVPPKVVQSTHRVHRVGFLRLGALSIISPGVRHGKIGFECPEGNKSREALLLQMGWKSYRVFWDFRAPEERCVYCCEVVPKNNAVKNSRKLVTEGEARVTVFRSPDSKLGSETFSSDSPSKIWERIIETLNADRSMAGHRGRTVFRGGNFYFGFTSILMNLTFNEEDGTNTTSFVESPLNLYHNILKRQQAYRGNWRGVSCEGSSRSAGTQLWKRTKKAKQLSLRDLYVTRDERSEEIQNLLSSYTIGSVNSSTTTSSSSNSSGSTGSGNNPGPLAISSATFAAMTNSPALSSLIGGNGSSFGITDSHSGGSGVGSSGSNFGNGAGVAGNEGGGRRGLIHHDTYELPMAIRYKQLLQSEDDFVSMKSPIQGLGMFASKLCTPESMLLEYRGEIIRLSVGDIREERYRKRGLADYLFSFSDKHIIDATMCGANARFVNHCHAPNCRAKIIQVSGMKHIVIVSKTFITPGEELCYDYNFPIEDESSKVPCTCAAPDCPGYMN